MIFKEDLIDLLGERQWESKALDALLEDKSEEKAPESTDGGDDSDVVVGPSEKEDGEEAPSSDESAA